MPVAPVWLASGFSISGRRGPLAEDDADGRFVEEREFERAPRSHRDAGEVGVEEVGAFGGDLAVNLFDGVGFDGDLGAVLRGVLGAGDDVGLRAVAGDDGQVAVLVEDVEAEAVDEEVEAFVEAVVEDFGDEVNEHLLSPSVGRLPVE